MAVLFNSDEAFQQQEDWPLWELEEEPFEGREADWKAPAHSGKVVYRDPTKQISVGVWECPPGKFANRSGRFAMNRCTMGKCILTDQATGHSFTVVPGVVWISQPNDVHIYDVIETMRKEYIVWGDSSEERFW
jgi:uncharacterized cupin superfamily protein